MSMMVVGQLYELEVLGDGSSSSLTVDMAGFYEKDPAARNKTPSSFVTLYSNVGTISSSSIEGTNVTLNWSSPIASGQVATITMQAAFVN